MSVELRITGANQAADLGRRLKVAGDKDLRKQLLKGIQQAAKPLKAKAQESAVINLPKRGGLDREAASATFGVRTRLSGSNVGVRIQATGVKNARGNPGLSSSTLNALNRGFVRHPVFGRDVWVNQPIKPGWFSVPLEAAADPVRAALLDAMDEVARNLTAKGL